MEQQENQKVKFMNKENITSTEYENTPDSLNILRNENTILNRNNLCMVNALEVKENRINLLNEMLKNANKVKDNLTKQNCELQKEISKLNQKITNLELNGELYTWNKKRK